MDKGIRELLGEEQPRPGGVIRLRKRLRRRRNAKIAAGAAALSISSLLLLFLLLPEKNPRMEAVLLQPGATVVVPSGSSQTMALQEVLTGQEQVRFYWVGSVGG